MSLTEEELNELERIAEAAKKYKVAPFDGIIVSQLVAALREAIKKEASRANVITTEYMHETAWRVKNERDDAIKRAEVAEKANDAWVAIVNRHKSDMDAVSVECAELRAENARLQDAVMSALVFVSEEDDGALPRLRSGVVCDQLRAALSPQPKDSKHVADCSTGEKGGG